MSPEQRLAWKAGYAEGVKDENKLRGTDLGRDLSRIRRAIAALATEVSLDRDRLFRDPALYPAPEPPRMSAEEVVERILYPEHFNV